MTRKPEYWTDLSRLEGKAVSEEAWNEFGPAPSEEEVLRPTRRDFLKVLGFSISGAVAAACSKTPVRYAVPYGVKPPEVDPGIPNWYATTCKVGAETTTVLVKNREGRPIKIEGHPTTPVYGEGTTAFMQAAVLSLYDSGRLRYPLEKGKKTSWKALDAAVRAALKKLADEGKEVALITRTVTGPASKAVIELLKAAYPNVRHVMYEPESAYALWKAHALAGMGAALPDFRFEKADVIVGLDADFLGTWISPAAFTHRYVQGRDVDANGGKMSLHIQFEPLMSLTGTNADLRFPVRPELLGKVAANLYNHIARKAGASLLSVDAFEVAGNGIAHAAEELWKHRGRGLVVCGVNDVAVQSIVLKINQLLGNYGETLVAGTSYQNLSDDEGMAAVVEAMKRGVVGGVIMVDVNPVYSLPNGREFAEALKNLSLSVAVADRVDETASHCRYVAPLAHPLESWGDFQEEKNVLSVAQPAITPLWDSREYQASLLAWAGEAPDFYQFLKNYWAGHIYPVWGKGGGFDAFWRDVVHDGWVAIPSEAAPDQTPEEAAPSEMKGLSEREIARRVRQMEKQGGDLTLQVYSSVGMRDGSQANNPWLHEMPDPMTKVVWDQYVTVGPATAKALGLTDEDVVEVTAGNYSVKLPVVVQPGQAAGTLGIAMGYGRNIPRQPHGDDGGAVANGKGKNAFPFLRYEGSFLPWVGSVSLKKTGATYPIARTQVHPSMEGRPLALSAALEQYRNGDLPVHDAHELVTLYKEWEYNGHHWGMAIDLSKCTGCSACVVSCFAENNIAMVGKEEVRRRREMHWMRIDRYYSGDPDNPEVIHQPVMCQQCDDAPCENVCPVMAIEHSDEGLNQQVYNRCVGTRYCANNCPYKVRRFNWFKYYENEKFADVNVPQNDAVAKMVLNPDVTVRARGVMEKCTFCVQRIQLAKLEAKKAGRALKDGEIQTACQQSCPAGAIVFGDMNDPHSAISKLLKNKRTYRMLEELGIRPSVNYMVKVRNKKSESSHHA